MTMVAVMLVDRKGRKFLLSVGTAGIIVSLVIVGLLFHRTEQLRVDVRAAVQALVTPDHGRRRSSSMPEAARTLLALGRSAAGHALLVGRPLTLSVIYSYGGFRATTAIVRSDDVAAVPLEITRDSCLPSNKVSAFFSNPFANLD